VRAEHGDRARRNLRQVLDEACTFRAQAFDDVPVVNDLVPNVDGRAKPRERVLDDIDGADDAGAKAARLCQHYLHGLSGAVRKITSIGYIARGFRPR